RENGWTSHRLVVGQGQNAVIVDRGADGLADLFLRQVGVDGRIDGHAQIQVVQRLAGHDFEVWVGLHRGDQVRRDIECDVDVAGLDLKLLGRRGGDRKSTRLNSSHQITPYAVF